MGGTSQNTERIPPSEGHSHPGDGIGRDKSGHRKTPTERGALTFWRRHREGQVRTQKESHRARGTHILETGGQVRTQKEFHRAMGTHPLETASGGTSQDTETIPPSDGHSHTGDGIGRDKSGHRNNPIERGATHILETASGGTSQNTKRIPSNEGHSLSGDGIGRDKSEHRKNSTERTALTRWRRHREGQVRIQKESHRAMGTHQLQTTSGRTSQDTERIPPKDGHSPTGDGIGRNKSGYRKNPTKRGALTTWRRNREGQVRIQKQSHRARGTHILATASGGTSQDTETIPPSEGRSHSGDGIGRDKSGLQKNPTERWALTCWRRHREGQVRTPKESHRTMGTHILETASGGQVRTQKESH